MLDIAIRDGYTRFPDPQTRGSLFVPRTEDARTSIPRGHRTSCSGKYITFWTEFVLLNLRKPFDITVNITIACRMVSCPSFKLIPASTHSRLHDTGYLLLGIPGVTWCVVSLAQRILTKRLNAVEIMLQSPTWIPVGGSNTSALHSIDERLAY